jgi:hypothetical protein
MSEDMLTAADFRASLTADAPPAGMPLPLQALWWSGKGRWELAHEIAQRVENGDGAWVHAHLHRVEGDLANAAHWYRRAGREVCSTSIDAEWRAISAEMLAARPGRG